MAANDPGIPPIPIVEDPVDGPAHAHKPSLPTGALGHKSFSSEAPHLSDKEKEIAAEQAGLETLSDIEDEDERPVAPDQFDPRYETTRWEIWAYYAYYIGNNGLTLFNFAPTAFQNLLSQAAGDSGVIYFAGGDRTINSVVLLCNGISFAIQVMLFLIIGSYAGKDSPGLRHLPFPKFHPHAITR